MDDYVRKSWEKALNAETMAKNLKKASLYITAFELLKSVLIENPKGFVNTGFNPDASDSPYKQEVRVLCKEDELRSCMRWFRQMGCLDESDLTAIREIREHRNTIAHELPKFLMDANFEINQQLFDSIHFYICKIERWWIREIEMPANSDYDGVDPYSIEDEEIVGGNMMAMNLILKSTAHN